MKTIKQLSIIGMCVLIVLPFLSCGSSKKDTPYALTTKTPFTIRYGSFQEWIAGVQGGGSGVNLVITFEEVNEGVVFQKLYFQNKISEVKQAIPKRIEGYFKGSTNREIIMDGTPVNETANTPPEASPFTLLRDEAVLRYTYNGKTQYTKVGPLVEEETIAYPSAPPNNNN
jgi:hypothetical protein